MKYSYFTKHNTKKQMAFEIRSYSPNTEKVTYTTFTDYAAALQWMGVLSNVGLQSSMTIKPERKN